MLFPLVTHEMILWLFGGRISGAIQPQFSSERSFGERCDGSCGEINLPKTAKDRASK
jgi:hypothetical protein